MAIPLLASPQGGVAERSSKYREASADREDGVVFRWQGQGKPPRLHRLRLLREILLVTLTQPPSFFLARLRRARPSATYLEIPSHSELENASLNDACWFSPSSAIDAGIRGCFGNRGIGIQSVVNVEIRIERRSLAKTEDLTEAQIELVQPIAEYGILVKHIDGFVTASAESAAQGWRYIGAGVDHARLQPWSRLALERAAEP